MSEPIYIGNVKAGFDALFIIAGPCVIESEDLCLQIADRLVQIQEATGVGIIFKSSFDKANRTSITSYRGPGMDEGLRVLEKVRSQTGLPIITDVHESYHPPAVGQVVDAVQIPAFLCRQTDLLMACAKTGKPVNVKKGQFMSPEEMTNAVGKLKEAGNDQSLLTDRGTFFGYNRLVNDMTGIAAMRNLGCPVIIDATHSTQQPGGLGGSSGGRRELAPLIARSAVAAGATGIFMEVHPDPDKALCDAASMMPLDQVQSTIETCKAIFEIVKSN